MVLIGDNEGSFKFEADQPTRMGCKRLVEFGRIEVSLGGQVLLWVRASRKGMFAENGWP